MIETDSIYSGDVLEFLSLLPNECADLIIADPPYSLDKDKEFGNRAFFQSRDEWFDWCKRWLGESKRILKAKGNLFVYAIHRNACFLQCHMYELGLEYRRQIIWYYENGWSKYRNGPACHYEPILWFARQRNSTFHVLREPYKSQERLRHAITKNGKIWKPNPDGRQVGDVWKFATLAGRRFARERTEHPTQKPLSLSRRLVEHFSNPGDLLVVPFVGSGSECVAAFETSRHFVGAEINPTYVKIARSRISDASAELLQKTPQETRC
jgi:site-specific DNA-methyltransferase (adenine-specific)/adenine-specific DNA-methyltransferase